MNIVGAVFPDRRFAEQAVEWLRSRGIPNENISVLTREAGTPPRVADREHLEGVHTDPGADLARGAGTGLAAGAGVGALFGLAAVFVPGLGPFITAGALAHALGAVGGAAAAGAIVGGTSGAIAGALSKWGLDKADAQYYADAIDRGSTFVAVDLSGTQLTREQVEEAFRVHDGAFARGHAVAAR